MTLKQKLGGEGRERSNIDMKKPWTCHLTKIKSKNREPQDVEK